MSVTGADQPLVDVRDAFCLHPVPDGAVAALRGLTLQVAAGERVVVHGPNGSGKTTLLRVLAGRQRLSAGRAVVAGVDVGRVVGRRDRRALVRWRATRLGWVDQYPARTLRPELGVLGNVALQGRLAGASAREAQVRAVAALDALGLGRLVGRAVAELSGGEAQRVAVCAALAHGPALVLADEPTGELDRGSAAEVYRLLAEASAERGAAMVLVSHDPLSARYADRVLRIRDGRLGETWRPEPAGGPVRELLVVDDRGWVRLPAPVWPGGRHPRAVAVQAGTDGVLLVPADPPEPRPPVAWPVPADPPEPRPTVAWAAPATAGSRASASGPAGRGGTVVATVRGLRRRFGQRVVLDGVDLDAVAGRLLVVRAPSGAGKSTLLRLLVGLDRPDAGTVTIAGQCLADLDRTGLAALRREVTAVVGQEAQPAQTLDALANLELARAVRGLPPDPDGDRRRLADLDLLPLAHRQVRLLSGGERQRVAVARALATGARLLVLDEPSSQLDEARAEQLAAVLRRAARDGAAVVTSSHDPTLVAAADDVLDLMTAVGAQAW
ncbi:MAG TPA: ATP-binding cassette domain-containing protein [Kineosporiaceae bacterium]